MPISTIRRPPGPCRTADAAAEHLGFLSKEAVEVFGVLLLDGKHKVIGWAETSRGTVNCSLVHPREVFGPALRMGATCIIVAHNHPSGDPAPSVEDIKVTERLIEAGKLLGVPLMDHVIIGNETHYAFRQNHFELWRDDE
jgi:DNA repair protein RadC